MKKKPNLTYKEFIQKISNFQINNRDKLQNKSPRALKSQNNNIFFPHDNNIYKTSQKKNLTKQNESKKKNNQRYSPRHTGKKENEAQDIFLGYKKGMNLKGTTNNKLILVNEGKLQQKSRIEALGYNKSLKESFKRNFYHNQSQYEGERHNYSCSTFNKNQNQQKSSTLNFGRKRSLNQKLKSRKQSDNSIDSKIRVVTKGNLTDRNSRRINTQYEYLKRQQDHFNTHYDEVLSQDDRQSPSFNKKSIDQYSFFKYQDDEALFSEQETSRLQKQTVITLLPEQQTSRLKKQVIPLNSSVQKLKKNQKPQQEAYNKFICGISQILFQITRIPNQDQLLEHRMKYIQYLESLKELGMIRNDYEPYSQGVDLTKQLWEQLILGHNIHHFIVIVAIILKITPLDMEQETNSPELLNHIYLQRKYAQFRFTRLELGRADTNSQMESLQHYDYSFKPMLSQQIASKVRSQNKHTINTWTIQNPAPYLTSLRQNEPVDSQSQNTTNHTQSLASTCVRFGSPLGNRRSEMLYKQTRKKSLQNRQNKSTIDYEYQKNARQSGFKPKITIKLKKVKGQQSSGQCILPRCQQKTINRMIKGRAECEGKLMNVDKDLPYNQEAVCTQKYQEVRKQQNQSRQKVSLKKSKVRIKVTQPQSRTTRAYNQVTQAQSMTNYLKNTQNQVQGHCANHFQNLESMLDLSFQQLTTTAEKMQNSQNISKFIQDCPSINFDSTDQNQQHSKVTNALDQFPQDYFTLVIYLQQDRSQKLLIRRESKIQQVNAQAQRFVRKHNLPFQMQHKLKHKLMIVMKFHNIYKIEENAEQQECSLLQ